MKKILSCFALFAFTTSSFAADFKTGSFELYQQIGYVPRGKCDIGSTLVLDQAEIMENLAFLSNFVAGVCEVRVDPNPRYYKISSETPDSCGSVTYKGSRRAQDGLYELKIVDNRSRTCQDLIPALVVVTEKGPQHQRTLYSYDH